MKELCNLMSEHGLVKDIRTIQGFFNAEDQSGSRVKCTGAKRNHIALLFARLIEEEILMVEGRGHWKVLEYCFVDEQGKELSLGFAKLLSKLKASKEEKSVVFTEVEEIISKLKRNTS